MAKTFLTGAVGFILFGASALIHMALIYLFPVSYGIFGMAIESFLLFIGKLILQSPMTFILYAFWTSIWILLIGIGCFSAKDDTNVAIASFIMGFIGILMTLISGVGQGMQIQAFFDKFNFGFIVGLFAFGDPTLPFESLTWATFTGGFLAGSPTSDIFLTLNLVNEIIIAVFFIMVASTFLSVDNRGYDNSYKVFTGILIIIYAIIIIILGTLPLLIGSETSTSAMQAFGLVFSIFGTLETVFLYLLPIFGVMMFVLIHLDNK
ncbi:MAG: hypothetical protein ACTSRG_09680 [Candidatus Helarchaeota archaeon]